MNEWGEFMGLRTIMIFPKFQDKGIIQEIRKKYDSLCDLVPAHITLAFPFEDEISNEELEQKLDVCLKEVKTFHLVMQGMSKTKDIYGNYLFLNVVEGSRDIVAIHKNLYEHIWGKEGKPFFEPHLTVGKLDTVEEMNEAYLALKHLDTRFETFVDKISVEIIGEHEECIIVIEKELH